VSRRGRCEQRHAGKKDEPKERHGAGEEPLYNYVAYLYLHIYHYYLLAVLTDCG